MRTTLVADELMDVGPLHSKRAREERAAAAERRMLALPGRLPVRRSSIQLQADADDRMTVGNTNDPAAAGPSTPSVDEEDEDDEDADLEPEDDGLRRSAMKGVMSQDEMNDLRLSKTDHCPLMESAEAGSSRPIPAASSSLSKSLPDDPLPPPGVKKRKVIEGMLQEEIAKRKREALGMDGPGRKLGGGTGKASAENKVTATSPLGSGNTRRDAKPAVGPSTDAAASSSVSSSSVTWACGVCTL